MRIVTYSSEVVGPLHGRQFVPRACGDIVIVLVLELNQGNWTTDISHDAISCTICIQIVQLGSFLRSDMKFVLRSSWVEMCDLVSKSLNARLCLR